MPENIVNPYKQRAEQRTDSLYGFIQKVKQESVAQPSDSVYVNKALDTARGIALAQKQSGDFLDHTSQLVDQLRANGARELQLKGYIFSTGFDLALRNVPGPFLLAASGLIKKLLTRARLNELAERVNHLLDPPSENDLNQVVEYMKKTPVGATVPEHRLRQRMADALKSKSTVFGQEVEAHYQALRNAGYQEWEIPGYLLMLGYMAGLVAVKLLPDELNRA